MVFTSFISSRGFCTFRVIEGFVHVQGVKAHKFEEIPPFHLIRFTDGGVKMYVNAPTFSVFRSINLFCVIVCQSQKSSRNSLVFANLIL